MKVSKSIVLFTTITLLFACKKDDPAAEASKILPGIGISELKIGEAAQVAIDLWGAGLKSYATLGTQTTHLITYINEGVDVYLVPTASETFDPQTKIEHLVLTAPYAGKTDKGIGIGSTKTEVVVAYGQPVTSSTFFGDEYANGLTFGYDDAGVKVEEIKVE